MVKHTFRGGVHPQGHKELSRDAALREYLPKGEVVFPLSQHIGKPARPLVQKGDAVRVGQRIAELDGYVSANVICSCSGVVKAIEKRRVLTGGMMDCIVVDNDGQFTPIEGMGERQDINAVTVEDILRRVRNGGIVGLGGAGFPTHVKLSPREPGAIRHVIANGAECEPYLSCNDRLMREKADEIVEGLEVMLKLFPNAEGVIAIEENKPEAIEAMTKASSGHSKLRVLPLKTKYPQGGERSLIQVVAGVDYPAAMLQVAILPADVGCVVENVGTIYAIQQAVLYKIPLFEHVFTLSGEAVANPGNYIVRDGTSFAELLEAAGGVKEGVEPKKALAGGPMMGIAMASLDVPIQKQNNGLTLLAEDPNEAAEAQMTACLRCGRCTTVCPMGLMPQMLVDAATAGDLRRYEVKLHGMECIQCGSCTYICPAKRPLMQILKRTKAEITARRRAEGDGKK